MSETEKFEHLRAELPKFTAHGNKMIVPKDVFKAFYDIFLSN